MFGVLLAISSNWFVCWGPLGDPWGVPGVAGAVTGEELRSLAVSAGVEERHAAPLAKASDVLYLILQRKDRTKSARFFEDFGLIRIPGTGDGGCVYLRARNHVHHCLELRPGSSDDFIYNILIL